jgi:DNA mismatch repair protein MutS2
MRASAAQERELAAAEARRELGEARAELAALREEIRLARRRDREARRAASASAAERERDRRLGAASAHAARVERELGALEEPLPVLGPLAVGDAVEAPGIGVRGTIAAIDGDVAEVAGAAGQRIRIALGRLQPDRRGTADERPRVEIRASSSPPNSNELDVRGRTAQEAREAVRSFVDDAALAGVPRVRVVHGRGTGALRSAVRDELARHPLVEASESESADGATVVVLGS